MSGTEEKRTLSINAVATQYTVGPLSLDMTIKEVIEHLVQENKEAFRGKQPILCKDGCEGVLALGTRVRSLGDVPLLCTSSPKPVVLDTGSATVRAGFADEDEPRIVLPTVVGVPKQTASDSEQVKYPGQEAWDASAELLLSRPVDCGLVQNWEDMELIWRHVFVDKLRVPPEVHPVLVSEKMLNPKANRERTMQVMFDTFRVPRLYLTSSSVLSLYQADRTTGVVMEIGCRCTSSVGIYEGYPLPHSYTMANDKCSGSGATMQLRNLLLQGGHAQEHLSEDVCNDIKTRLCYVRHRGVDAIDDKHTFTLPDGTNLTIGPEVGDVADCFFQGEDSLCDSLRKCISKIDTDIKVKENIHGNIVVSGCTAQMRGLPERLREELTKVSPASVKIKVVRSNALYAAWRGGSILAGLSAFQDMWVTQEEYENSGPGIVHRKCV